MSPDPTRRNERSRRAILEAASELVADTGFVRLTVEAIAARAGVGKQTIYRWWPSKGAVVFDALLAEGLGAEGESRLPDTGDLRADLGASCRAASRSSPPATRAAASHHHRRGATRPGARRRAPRTADETPVRRHHRADPRRRPASRPARRRPRCPRRHGDGLRRGVPPLGCSGPSLSRTTTWSASSPWYSPRGGDACS
jgi:AcrR family transcriptional regulator